MKTTFLIMAISCGTVVPILGQPATNLMATATLKFAAVKVEKVTAPVATPLTVISQKAKPTTVNRVENISSRPWTQVVGWRQDQFAADAERYHEPQFALAWIGNEPPPWSLK